MKIIFIILFLPELLLAHIGRMFLPTNENININPFILNNIEYKSIILNCNHSYDNVGNLDLSFVFPSEWNGVIGMNFYVYNYPGFPVFRNTTPSTKIDYGLNLNYSDMIFNSGFGIGINMNVDRLLQEVKLIPGLAYLLNDQFGNYSFVYIAPVYKVRSGDILLQGGYFGRYNERLSFEGVIGVPFNYAAKNVFADISAEYRLPLDLLIGGDARYENGNLFSSAKVGLSFDYIGVYGGVRYKNMILNNYFVELAIVSRFGGIVKF